MSLVIALDAGPLGLLTHRNENEDAEACRKWLASQIAAGAKVIVPDVADYEVRRELLRAGKTKAVARLHDFIRATPDRYLPPNGGAFFKPAELWAQVRREGLPTAGDEALDADVLFVAQLLTSGFEMEDLVVATTNPKHLSRFPNAREWQNI